MIGPAARFDLIHVGKCGGGSIVEELRARNYQFGHIHMQRPVAEAGRRYVILVRDPVARFVSAFNWRRHRLAHDPMPAARSDDPITRLRHRSERELLEAFEDANAFAERLVRTDGREVTSLTTMMALIGHVPQGFAWYLDHLLERIEPEQLAGVIATERLAADVERLFGFRPTAERNRHAAGRPPVLSPAGRANLAREFDSEYRTLSRLDQLASRAGAPMSIRYDPGRGAVPV
jgi:hypothetical protein